MLIRFLIIYLFLSRNNNLRKIRKLDATHAFAREGDTENLIKCVEAGIPVDIKIQKLNGIIEELVKEKEDDKERLNGVIEDLVKEKERDKVKKQVILDRMTKFEELLKLVS
ncbi:hypothetical protein L1987_33227 [Smallanthus sonchifolius]|uniref:Uncharacterized protein n=1 Tax=Smallanthus sonchifolius TaxID=185202 RepID=A0ACB9HQ77_9ASTR|nr:hypothetical protein L1987_33227 [Smallanthus sonchifolius]